MDSTLKAQKRLDSLLGQLKAVETGNPLSRSAAGTSSGSASSYASVPEPAREEERPEGRGGLHDVFRSSRKTQEDEETRDASVTDLELHNRGSIAQVVV